MGYSTEFKGAVKFKQELTASQLAEMKRYLGEDMRDLLSPNDYDDIEGDWCHLNMEFTDDFSGLQWDGAEKTNEIPEMLNFLTKKMREKWEDFEFTGEFFAQGEDYGDVWMLQMIDGVAVRKETPRIGGEVECPHCEETFILLGK